MKNQDKRTTKFRRSKYIILALVLTAIASIATMAQLTQPTAAQIQPETRGLEVGKPVESELAGGQSHTYPLTVAAGQYLNVVIDQRGIDVVVVLFAPDGKKLIEVDSPNGPQGTEPLMWITESSGRYRLEIRSLEKEAKAGRYEVKILDWRATTNVDRVIIEALSLYNESLALGNKRKYTEAIPLAERALTIRENALGHDHLDVAQSLSILAMLYRGKGDYPKAELLFEQLLAIREKLLGPDHPSVVITLNNLGGLYSTKGDYAKAELLYKRVLAICEKTMGVGHLTVAVAANNLGVLYQNKGDYAKAEPLYQRAFAIREKLFGPDHPDIAVTINNLGLFYRSKGDYAKAELLLQRALTIYEKLLVPNHQGIALGLNNLGDLYRDKGDYAKAEPLLQRALAIREKLFGSDHLDIALSLNNLGSLYRDKGDYTKAEPLYQRALAIREKLLGPDHLVVARSLNNLGLLYRGKGDYAKAKLLYQRALAIHEKSLGPNHPDIAVVLNNLARFYSEQGNVQQAIAFAVQAAEITEFNLNQTVGTGSERQKLLFLKLHADEMNFTSSVHAQWAPADPQALKLALTTHLRRKGRGLEVASDAFATLRKHATSTEQVLFDKLVNMRSQLATLTLRGRGSMPAEQFHAQLKQLAADADKIEAEISAYSAEFRVQMQPVTIEAIQAALPKDTALVEYAIYRPLESKPRTNGTARYIAYVIAPQGQPRWVELGEASVIDQAVESLRQALRDAKQLQVKSMARAADEKVMRPVRALLGGTRQLLLSPDGALNLVPFAALVDEQNRYLVERYSISYLTSGRDLLRLQAPTVTKQEPLVVANPDFTDGGIKVAIPTSTLVQNTDTARSFDLSDKIIPRLFATEKEAQALRTLLPDAKVLTGAQATEAAIKQVKGPRILHIATHGFFLPAQKPTATVNPNFSLDASEASVPLSENPLLRSGLFLAGAEKRQSGKEDGVLTALEASGLDLWGTELVVLSACETGLGDLSQGEGVYGLRRALALAGAKTQVMSLWSVKDVVTKDLMIAYYKRLLASEGRGEALRQVQLLMLKDPKYSHPFYWASFIQSGHWAPLTKVAAKGRQ